MMLKCIAVITALLLFTPIVSGGENESIWSSSYTLEANGKYEKAAALLVPFLDRGEYSEFALMRYGWLSYLQGNHNDAIRSYKRALKRNPRSFDARLGIALPLMAQQRWKEASGHLRQLLAKSPYNYTAHIRLMVCEEGLRKWEQLEKHTMDIAAYYPSDATILVYLARTYAWQGKNILAKNTYRKVLARFPENIEALRFINR